MKALLLAIFFAAPVFAQDITCTIEEFSGGASVEQTVDVTVSDQDPHGSMKFFTLQKYKQYEGFVASVKEFAVISLQTHNGDFSFTSQGNVMKGEFASLQVLVPSEDNNPSGVLILCSLKKQN